MAKRKCSGAKKPLCPKCGTEFLIVEKFTRYSECDGLEESDPSLPIVGSCYKEFGDDAYQPHYYCDECSVDYSFSLEPLTYQLVEQR